MPTVYVGSPTHGHYIVTRDPSRYPLHYGAWHTKGEWHLWVDPFLAVRDWPTGWLLGSAINLSGEEVEPHEFNEATQDGRWVHINLEQGYVLGGAAHFLGICHHTQSGDVSSNPSLLSSHIDGDLIEAINQGRFAGFFPFGLTAHKDVRRTLPNHRLDLERNESQRIVWPQPSDGEPEVEIEAIIAGAKAMLAYTRKSGPLALALTGGTDSRIVLAIMREQVPDVMFTFKPELRDAPMLDLLLARQLAKLTGIRHIAISPQAAGDELEQQYLELTGHVILSNIKKASKMRLQLSDYAEVSGVAAELYRSYYQYPEDDGGKLMTPEYLVERILLPPLPQLVKEAGIWLEKLGTRELDPVLNFSYIEHRVGSWAAPQSHFWTAMPHVAPFVTHTAYQAMLRLPREYRVQASAVRDICMREWPELLSVPINEIPKGTKVAFLAQKAFTRVLRKLKVV